MTASFYMTYSLHTLHSSAQTSPQAPTGMGRFVNEIALIGGFVFLALWLTALLTYSAQDAAWSTSGTGLSIANKAGRLGAWWADVSYFLLGFSAWWCVAVGVRLWLALLANRLRGDTASHAVPRKFVFWIGLALALMLLPVVAVGLNAFATDWAGSLLPLGFTLDWAAKMFADHGCSVIELVPSVNSVFSISALAVASCSSVEW